MVKILVTGAYCVLNKGDAALRLGGLPSLKQKIPEAEFAIMTLFPDIDSKIYHDWKVIKAIDTPIKAIDSVVRCSLWRIFDKYLGIKNSFTNKLIDSEGIRDYAESDIVLDISGDSISEVTGLYGTIYHLLHVWLAITMGKPTIIYAQSVGPFRYTKSLAKSMLNKVDLITLRGRISYDYLESIGINKPPMYLTADLAFLMSPASTERIDMILSQNGIGNGPLVGISASNWITKYYGSYEEFLVLMNKIIDYIVNELNATVVFIPHVTGPKKENDDRLIAEDIYRASNNQNKIKLINDDYTPQEMKGIIGRCDLFIGARMHACIGALSMQVPTINISYHHKSKDIMTMFGLEDNVISGQEVNYDRLIYRINETWLNKENIKKNMASTLAYVNEQASLNAEIASRCIQKLSV